ncbi:MAG: SIS domain-containing protein [Armatimonadota bacterium]
MSNAIKQAVEAICECHSRRGKILVCGNGGSAADSGHIAGELMKNFCLHRQVPDDDKARLLKIDGGDELAKSLQPGMPVIALCDQSVLSTAIINDTDPAMIYAQQVYVYGRPGDIMLGISTSGNAVNVSNALKVAKAFGLVTIGMTGTKPSKMNALCDVLINAPASETYLIQEYHLPIYHTICLMVEHEAFG